MALKGGPRPPLCHPDKPYFAKDKCRNCYLRENYRPKHRERIIEFNRKYRYGVMPEQYAELLKTYDSCAICGGPWTQKGPALDHNHETKKVRALLCSPCNTGLGSFKEDPRILKEALRYIEFWS